jgi:hypothetical protein
MSADVTFEAPKKSSGDPIVEAGPGLVYFPVSHQVLFSAGIH